MSDSTDEETSTIIVDIPSTDTPEIIEGDTTVIIEANEDASEDTSDALDAVVIEQELDIVQRLTRIEQRLFSIEDDVWEAKFAADNAQDAIDELAENDEAIVEATDEAIVETIEDATIDEDAEDDEGDLEVDAIAPVSAKVHPLFRPWADWRNG